MYRFLVNFLKIMESRVFFKNEIRFIKDFVITISRKMIERFFAIILQFFKLLSRFTGSKISSTFPTGVRKFELLSQTVSD